MLNQGIRYFVDANCGENIYDFAREVVEFRATLKRDIIAKFNEVYIHVNQTTTKEDIIKTYIRNVGE